MPGSPGVAGSLRATFVIATYNRRDVLLHTIGHILRSGLAECEYEVLIVDNASTDGTAAAIGECFPTVQVLRQSSNRGPCAKNAALRVARSEFIVFLDDDSYPESGSIRSMIAHFEADPGLGAAVFSITLPDGSRECSAYPNICIGCGTGFRREALRQVGGLPEDFFMAAEEYDLSLRLLDAGWRVERFDDLHVTHLKSPASRFPRRIARLDARNNTILALRYFPEQWRFAYALEWLERYRLLSGASGRTVSFWSGAVEGIGRGLAMEHRPISKSAFEQFAKVEETASRMAIRARELGVRRVLFADLGKNILAYRLAARRCGLEVVGITDARIGGRGRRFRGLPVLSDDAAARLPFDAVVISNLSPVHARHRTLFWRQAQSRPVVDLFEHEANACIHPRVAA